NIDFLIRHRHSNIAAPEKIPFHSILAEPMRLALSRKSGTIVGLDYRGERVLAAFEPVDVLNLGIVAKIDLSELRAPFIKAALAAIGISILLIFFGSFLFFTVTNPMIKKIIASEENFRLLVSEVKDYAILRLSPEGIVSSWNEGAQLIKGYKAKEIIGEHFSRFYNEADIEAGKPDNELEIANRVGKYEEIGWRVRKDGSRFIANVVITALRDNTGKLKGYSKVTRDITERKLAEERLNESEERYRAMLSNLGVGIVVHAPNTSIVTSNPRAEELLGLTSDQLRGKVAIDPEWEFTSEDNTPLAHDEYPVIRILTSKKPVKDQILGIQQPGNKNVVWLTVNGFPMLNKAGEIVEIVISSIDITERKQAENSLQQSEERFTMAMNASTDGLFDWNLETNEIYYSPGWKKMLGYEDHELANDFSVWERTTNEEDVKKSWELQQKLIAKQIDRFVLEFKMKHKNGHWVDILSRAEAVFNVKGKAIRIVGTHSDITERKKSEAKLRESEENFQQVVSNITTAIWKADIGNDGTFENTYTSPVYDELLGLPSDGSTNNWDKHLTYVKPEHKEIVNAAFIEAIESPGKVIDLDFEVLKENGQTAWFNSRGRCFEKNGKLHVFGSTTDVTEKKQAEEELRLQSEIIQNMNEGVYLVGLSDGLIKYTNPKFEQMFGYDPGEMIGKPVSIVNAPTEKYPEETVEDIMGVLEREGKWEGEIENIKKDGTPFWCYANVIVF
ncbi:MAG: PAS domain S-box protein, partial [Calditrichaeota bacterium]|nr:PAS domain S-box protein [Calditrichota bacterium]